MELHDRDMPYDEDWARRVLAALSKHYNGSALSAHVPEYAPWMLTPLRTVASAYTPERERKDIIGDLRYKLGIASMHNQWRSMHDLSLSERGFTEMLLAQSFLQALPLTVDHAGVRFSMEDYSALQEKFGEEGMIAGKLNAVGITPGTLAGNGMFVLAPSQGKRLLNFLEGNDALEAIHPVDIEKRNAWVATDTAQLQRYHDVMPHVLNRMCRTIDVDYTGLFQYAPDLLSQLLTVDTTPVEDGFADPAPSAGVRSPLIYDMLFACLKTYREKRPLFYSMYYAPSLGEIERTASEDARKLTDFFKGTVRAHMGVNQLQFWMHSQVNDVNGKEKPIEALSIDAEQLRPWIERCHVTDEIEFFKLLGISAEPYAGLKDAYNGCAARIIITDPKAIGRIKELGAQVVQVPVRQIGDALRRERASIPFAVSARADVLHMADWKARVAASERRREERRNRPDGPTK